MASVGLSFRDGHPRPDICERKAWAGFSVEHVGMGHARAFDYAWCGSSHYLATHDILLRDGELAVDGHERVHRTNLRNRLTFVPQDTRVSGWSDLAAEDQSYLAVFFAPGLAEVEYERPLLRLAVRPLLYFENVRLCGTLQRLKAVVTSADPEPAAAETLGLLAVLQLYPLLGGTAAQAPGQLTLIQRRQLAEFIEARIGTAISLAEMAAVAGLSRYHFARSFSRTYGRAPHQHLLLRRIGLAASLLTATRLPIGEIAMRVGFLSPARLSIAFRRIIGRTPSEFRRAVQ